MATLVAMADNSSPYLAMNVAALRFDFNTTENGYSGYSEIDVFGVQLPEPGSIAIWSLLGVSGLGFAFWRSFVSMRIP